MKKLLIIICAACMLGACASGTDKTEEKTTKEVSTDSNASKTDSSGSHEPAQFAPPPDINGRRPRD